MKSTSIVTALLLTSVLAACNSDSTNDVESVAPPPIPASDVDFIDNLVPHHQLALQMAEIELAKGARPDVRDMAQMMKSAQQEEIAKMLAIRTQVDGSGRIASMRDPHGEEDLARLAESGSDVDAVFLRNMIPHHAGAVSLAHRALENLSNPDLGEMANMTIVVQTREMNAMLDMLGE